MIDPQTGGTLAAGMVRGSDAFAAKAAIGEADVIDWVI